MADEAYPLGYTGEKTKALLKKIDELEVDVLDILVGGIEIKAGDDLDDYVEPGIYKSMGSAISSTLGHCPYKEDSFILKVRKIAKTGTVVKHTLYTGSVNNMTKTQFVRTKSSNGWSEWYNYATKEYVDANARSDSFSITVPASAWAAGSLTYLGQTYTQKAAVTVAAAKGTGKGLIVEPTSGSSADLQAWGVVDVSAGKVILYSTAPLTGDITLRITEVF